MLNRGGDREGAPLWPVWEFDSGYAGLAPYVAPQAVAMEVGLNAELTPQEEAGRSDAELDRLRARRLYERLRDKGIKYGLEPWASREGVQQIRHPWWLLNDLHGTCLDIAATYAAMCLQAQVGALAALTEGHAFVVLTPGRLHREGARERPCELDGFGESERPEDAEGPGVLQGTMAALERAVANDRAIAVNVVDVTEPAASFESASAPIPGGWAEDGDPGRSVWLVDVPYLHTLDRFAELEQPGPARPTIRLQVPGGGDFIRFPSHGAVIEQLEGGSGTHALIGPSGRGKSTIARHLAQNAKYGAAWFLDASDRKALINSLAMARLLEQGRSEREVPAAERNELARSALAQLRAEGPWLVVLDNADGDPATLRGWIPQPKAEQQLLVTTTNRDWGFVPECTPHELPAVEAGELPGVGDAGIADLIEGRPLLFDAFARLGAAGGAGAGEPAAADGIEDELRGPVAFWARLRAGEGFGETELRVSALAAFLPPNGQPVSALEGLVGGAGGAVELLVARGLLAIDRNLGAVRMHRLFGAAVRWDLEVDRPSLCDEVALSIAGDPGTRAALDEYGDLSTVSRLDERLAAIDARSERPDPELGIALHGIAGLLELHGHTRRSGATYERAEKHLAEHPVLLADCLHGRARTVNQHHTGDRAMLEEAIGWAESARRLLIAAEGEEANADRFLAMQGLLMKPLADFPVAGKTKLMLLEEALEVLEEADRRRQGRADVSAAEKARSRFNLAGIRIPMAQQEPERAAEHLAAAHAVYAEVGQTRRELYGRADHPHIAACEHGLALVGYYRALLVPASRSRRSLWLREATDHAGEALKQREVLDGSVDFDEAVKSAGLLAKIALARHASPVASPPASAKPFEAAAGELARAGIVLEPVPPLPPDGSGLVPAIDRWARSKALREVVHEFDQRPPLDRDLAGLLEWLEQFSERWDFRRGERNVVVAPQLTQVTEKVVRVAAEALGLVGGGAARAGRYDQVLILGGRARGCLSRPRLAAKLIEEGAFEADAVTALGAFRGLDEGEVGLVERVEGVTVGDEFEAMEAGVRTAFGLAEPSAERGEDADALGASWRVREYETAAGPAVSVVAAPSSEPGKRRANTPDTLAWFATELARLEPGQRVLFVTTDIYVPYQHADALRMLALPYGVEVDAVGVNPGQVDPRLALAFEPHNYLQEIRSTIRSLRRLLAAAPGDG